MKKAQTLIEYAFVLLAVTVVAFGAYRVLGNSISSIASGISSDMGASA